MSELVIREQPTRTLSELARTRRAKIDVSHLVSPLVSGGIEQTNINHYRTKNTGHGYAAEDANALNDVLSGRRVELTGKTRELNGADRIVDGVQIQTKYCQSARESINAAFDNGQYRYPNQVIEVPKDQYKDAVELMRQRIQDGQVPGVTDPGRAEELVKEGSITYLGQALHHPVRVSDERPGDEGHGRPQLRGEIVAHQRRFRGRARPLAPR